MSGVDIVIIYLKMMTFSIALFGMASLLAHRDDRKVGWGLALFLGVVVLDACAAMVGLWGLLPDALWLGVMAPIVVMLYGPAMYLYVLTVTGRHVPQRRALLTLGLPLAPALILMSTLLLYPPDIRTSILLGVVPANSAWGMPTHLSMALMKIIFLLVTFGFVVAAWRALDENLRRLSALFSSLEDRTLSWMRGVMLLITLAWAWAAVQSLLQGSNLGQSWLDVVDTGIMLVWVAMLAHFGLHQRPSLHDAPPEAEAMAENPGKYARSALDEDRMRKLAERMVAMMLAQSLYRDPDLSLRRLADKVGASPNYISQTLNDHLGVSFFDFVNGFRVDEAEALLRTTDRSVTDIALEVGFNSRSTFNAAIRKHRNASPTEMRRSPAPMTVRAVPPGPSPVRS